MSLPTVAMLTDFGQQDGFVGILKAVIYKTIQQQYTNFSQTTNTMPHIIDLSHDIGRQDVYNASWVLQNSFNEFPEPTIFVCVVDPEVGNPNQKQLLMIPDNSPYYFVAPDNGLLTPIIHHYNNQVKTYSIENPQFFRQSSKASQTFHGRDIYAPIAAHTASALMQNRIDSFLQEVGPLYERPQLLPWLVPIKKEATLQGHVVHCDVYGNIITNIPGDWLNIGETIHVTACAQTFETYLVPSYSQAEQSSSNQVFMVVSSSGTLELFVPYGNARNILKASTGNDITVQRLITSETAKPM